MAPRKGHPRKRAVPLRANRPAHALRALKQDWDARRLKPLMENLEAHKHYLNTQRALNNKVELYRLVSLGMNPQLAASRIHG